MPYTDPEKRKAAKRKSYWKLTLDGRKARNARVVENQRQAQAKWTPERWDKLNARRRERYKQRMTDPKKRAKLITRQIKATTRYRATLPRERQLRFLLANRVSSALKGIADKSASTLRLLSCDIPWLKAWLEVHFQPGMTWDNYGMKGWHVDHIRPCASFNLVDHKEQKRCFHWTNLQPLWALENLQKSDKWEEIAA
jgi:hypothetical protein